MRIFILNRGKDNILLASPCSVVYLYILRDIIPCYGNDGSYMTADPDAVVAWVGADPGFKLDLSWKNLIPGQASGESYMFEWTRPSTVIIQPNERTSGIDIGIDGRGGRPTRQENHLFRQDGNQMIGQMQQGMQQGGGLGGALGGILGGMMNGNNNGF